jgi:hypothetical protein
MVHHLTVVDPVSLLLGLPEVAYNFLYRPPTDIIQSFILYGASREITISHMLHRHFWWHRNICYLEDIPAHIGVVVAVSSEDPILDARSVFAYAQICEDIRQGTRNKLPQQVTPFERHHINTYAHSLTQKVKQICDETVVYDAVELFDYNSGVENVDGRAHRRIRKHKVCKAGTKSPITVVPNYESSSDSLTTLLASATAKLEESLASNLIVGPHPERLSKKGKRKHRNTKQTQLQSSVLSEIVKNGRRSFSFSSDSNSSDETDHFVATAVRNGTVASIKALYWEGYTHGQFLTSSWAMNELICALRTNEHTPESK